MTMLEKLKKHLKETPREQLEKEWAEIEEFSDVGPTVEEYMKHLDDMDEKEKEFFEKSKKFLDYLKVDYSGDTILLNSGDNSIIMNTKSQWYEDFGGYSISGIAEYVAKKLGKKIEWEDESY